MNPKQSQLPGLLTAGTTVECGCNELHDTLAKIKAEHLHVLRMDVRPKPQGYRLLLSKCCCDICQSITGPSDQIEGELAEAETGAAKPAMITSKESFPRRIEAMMPVTPTNRHAPTKPLI